MVRTALAVTVGALVVLLALVSCRAPRWPALVRFHALATNIKAHHKAMRHKEAQLENFERLHQICGDIVRALPQPSLVFALFGTLLGMTRRQQLIAYDHDLDFGMLAEDRDTVVHALQTQLDPNQYDVIVVNLPGLFVCQVWHREYQLHADLSVFREDTNHVFWRDTWWDRCPVQRDELLPLVARHCAKNQVTVYCPAQSEKLLASEYGPTWHTSCEVEYV